MPDLSFLHASQFYELTALLVLAALVGSVGLLFRQPMIVCFIAVGVLAGDAALGIVQSDESIELLAGLGWPCCCFWSDSSFSRCGAPDGSPDARKVSATAAGLLRMTHLNRRSV